MCCIILKELKKKIHYPKAIRCTSKVHPIRVGVRITERPSKIWINIIKSDSANLNIYWYNIS